MTEPTSKQETPQKCPHSQLQQWHSSGSVTSKTSAAFKLATLQGNKSLTAEQGNKLKLTPLPGKKKPPAEKGSKTAATGPKSDQENQLTAKGHNSACQPLTY